MDDAPTAPKMWHARFLDECSATQYPSARSGAGLPARRRSFVVVDVDARAVGRARLDAAAIPVVSAREAMGTLLTSLREVSARLDVAISHVEELNARSEKMGSK